jgi:methylated-DNA-protein-cysteine methyltransferase related protein
LLALKELGPQEQNPVPWQRVISASGTISSRGPGTTGADRQRVALEAEGVTVTTGRTGELRINLAEFGWFPAVGTVQTLPDQEAVATAPPQDGTQQDSDLSDLSDLSDE